MSPNPAEQHRYTLVLDKEFGEAVEQVAKKKGTTFTNMVRRFISFGFFVEHAQSRGERFIIREKGKEDTQILFLDLFDIEKHPPQ